DRCEFSRSLLLLAAVRRRDLAAFVRCGIGLSRFRSRRRTDAHQDSADVEPHRFWSAPERSGRDDHETQNDVVNVRRLALLSADECGRRVRANVPRIRRPKGSARDRAHAHLRRLLRSCLPQKNCESACGYISDYRSTVRHFWRLPAARCGADPPCGLGFSIATSDHCRARRPDLEFQYFDSNSWAIGGRNCLPERIAFDRRHPKLNSTNRRPRTLERKPECFLSRKSKPIGV